MTGRYLNFASFGPPHASVLAAAHRIDERAAAGEAAAALHAEDAAAIAAVSRLTGFDVEGVTLMPNTSTALFQAAFAVPAGGVIVSREEFPANLYPWRRAAEVGRLRVDVANPADPSAPLTPADVAEALRPDTVAVAVSAVSFRTGHRADLRGIRDVIGDRLLVVDAIQGMGVVDQDWTLADVVVSGGQKWLRAGWGTGFLALSSRALDQMVPLLSGWTGVEDAGVYSGEEHPRRADARRFTVTNGAPSASAALRAAIAEIESAGLPALAAAVAARADALRDHLIARGADVLSPASPSDRAGIVVARFADADAVHARLSAEGFTTTRVDADRIRFSPHASTPLDVLEVAADVVAR